MEDLAIDACCLINLLSAGGILPTPRAFPAKGKPAPPKDRPSALATTLHVPGVVARESLYLLQPDEDDERKLVKAPIDLAPYFARGVLAECAIEGEEEMRLLVQYATKLDDGEAECLAVAKNRGWSFATDDRLASNIARREGVPVLTTAGLVERWADLVGAEKREIAVLLSNIQRYARFVPRRNTADATWWSSHFPNM